MLLLTGKTVPLNGNNEPAPKLGNSIISEIEEFRNESSFPFEVFPSHVQRIITATNETLNYATEFTSASILYGVSVAIGNRYLAQIKQGWKEHGVLYIALVANSGTGKTAPLNFILKPFHERDKEHYQRFRTELATYQAEQSKPRKEQDLNLKQPTLSQHLVNDVTPESLYKVLEANPNGIGLY